MSDQRPSYVLTIEFGVDNFINVSVDRPNPEAQPPVPGVVAAFLRECADQIENPTNTNMISLRWEGPTITNA
jgi:hypothetical protein